MKGVSAIIATILMLIITIGLAGTAYVYISGIMTAKTTKVISLTEARCAGSPRQIYLTVSNDGRDIIDNSVATAPEMIIMRNGVDATSDFTDTTGSSTYTINPNSLIVLNSTCGGAGCSAGTAYEMILRTTASYVRYVVTC